MNVINKAFQKANFQFTKHSKYFEIYEKNFHDLYEKNLTIVEIGVLHGGSLEVYKKLFKNSRIIGIDWNPKVKQLEQYGFEIFIADQADFNKMNKVFGEIGSFDILIDDGGHTYEQQITTCEVALKYANEKSLIIVEDTHTSYINEFDSQSRYTFQKYAFNKVDKLNNNFFKSGTEDKIYSIEFYESITIFNINKKLTQVENQNIYNNGTQIKELRDFRNIELINTKFYKQIQNFFYYFFRSRWTKKIMMPFAFLEQMFFRNYFLLKTKKNNKNLKKYFWESS